MVINFSENGTYYIKSDLLFNPPQFDKAELDRIYRNNNALVAKVASNISLKPAEATNLKYLADTYLICYLNGFEEAKERIEMARSLLKAKYPNLNASLKEALRVLRKVKYS